LHAKSTINQYLTKDNHIKKSTEKWNRKES
jgi:hypothetical protein